MLELTSQGSVEYICSPTFWCEVGALPSYCRLLHPLESIGALCCYQRLPAHVLQCFHRELRLAFGGGSAHSGKQKNQFSLDLLFAVAYWALKLVS